MKNTLPFEVLGNVILPEISRFLIPHARVISINEATEGVIAVAVVVRHPLHWYSSM
jgi:hypothetical protein